MLAIALARVVVFSGVTRGIDRRQRLVGGARRRGYSRRTSSSSTSTGERANDLDTSTGRFGTLLTAFATTLLATALAGCGGSATDSCAPAGTYVPLVTRSADPGDCPAGLDLLQVDTHQISSDQACGVDHETFDGGQLTHYSNCGYQGSGTLVASSSGITGTATITTSCWGDGTKSCTANYDIVFTRTDSNGGPDAGSSGGTGGGVAGGSGSGGTSGSPITGAAGTTGGSSSGGAAGSAGADGGTTNSTGTGGAGGAGPIGVLTTGAGVLDVVGARYATSSGSVTAVAGAHLVVVTLQPEGSTGSVPVTELQAIVDSLKSAGVYLTDNTGASYPFVLTVTGSAAVVEVPCPVPLAAGPTFQLIWSPNAPLTLMPTN
jgi:hypothetical protein